MVEKRIIPCLLLKDEGFYKTTRFSNPQYVGDPINTIKIFNDKEVDEILILDIASTRSGKGPQFEYLAEVAREAFIPLGYGGGVSDLETASKLYQLGFEKIAFCSAIYKDPELIHKVASRFGSQAVIAVLNLKKNFFGKYQVYDYVSGKTYEGTPEDWMSQFADAGVGEILIQFVDLDGSLKGMDITYIQRLASAVKLPLIACGGASSLNDMVAATQVGASAAAAGALFVYYGPHRAVLINYPDRNDIEKAMGLA